MKLVFMRTPAEMKVWVPKQVLSKGASVVAMCPNCGRQQVIDAGIADKYGEGQCANCGMVFPVGFIIPDANYILQNKQARFMFYLN